MTNLSERGALFLLASACSVYLACTPPNATSGNRRVEPPPQATSTPASEAEQLDQSKKILIEMRRDFPDCIVDDLGVELRELSTQVDRYRIRHITDLTSQTGKAFVTVQKEYRSSLQELALRHLRQNTPLQDAAFSLAERYGTFGIAEYTLARQFSNDLLGLELSKLSACHFAKKTSILAPYALPGYRF